MLAPIKNLKDRGFSHGTFFPLHALLIITYGFLYYLYHVYVLSSLPVNRVCEFVTFPQFWGLSPLDLFTGLNVLLAVYLLVSAWSLIRERGRQTNRKIFACLAYVFSLALVILLQVSVHQMAECFELPNELLNLHMNEYQDITPRGNLEEVVVPYLDQYDGYDASEKRCLVSISRPGHYVVNRRDRGVVDDAIDTIIEDMEAQIRRNATFVEGVPDMALLIRADKKAEFKYVYRILQLCRKPSIHLKRVEFACRGNLKNIAPEAYEKIGWCYCLPEGKLDYTIPNPKSVDPSLSGGQPSQPTPLEINIHFNKSLEGRFAINIDGSEFKGPDMLTAFHSKLESLI